MDEELEIFLEDCDDQLQMMETGLLNMQKNGVNDDCVGAIFRAVHTIKGSAGMFGFEKIVTFAHAGENLFEFVRQGNVEVSRDMIDTFLLCKDHMEKLIAAETDNEDLDADEQKVGETLIKKLFAFIPNEDDEKTEVIEVQDLSEETNNLSEEVEEKGIFWHISLRFKKDFFTTGMSIHSIFNFLNKIGKIKINCPIIGKIPLLEDFDPIFPYIGFELLVQADNTIEDMEEVFEFIQEDIVLMIFDSKEKNNLEVLLEVRDEEELQKELINNEFYQLEDFKVIDEVLHVEKPEKVEDKKVKKETKSKEKKQSSSLRVDSNKIDILINQMSEIVIANSKILTLVDSEENIELEEASFKMKELLESVRNGIMDIRMVQVEDSFNKFHRIINDTAKKIGKDIEFVVSGGDTELDKTVVERISDPLVHMLRNSIDHGIELPEDRIKKGKPATGKIDLRTYPDSGTIVIEIEDDGKGLDKDRILAKAIENGQVDPDAQLSDAQIYKLIFAAGLSTADKVSDISGRGVGMDVVKRNIEDLRGTIEISSTLHKGSKITIRLPLTLAIIDGFLVQVGETKYIIPLESIQECIELTKTEEENMQGNEFINLRGEMLPILDVRKILNEEKSLSKRQNVVIVYFGNKMIGLLVDELLGEHQTVIKPLGPVFVNVAGISGGSILGTGEVALIFDIARLIEYKI